MSLYLSEQEVAACLPMAEAVEVVRAAFASHGRGHVTSLARWRPDQRFHLLAAAVPDLDAYGFKSIAPGARHVQLFRWSSGALEAVLESGRLSEIRTGATTALAVDLLARPDAGVHALLGAGVQAPWQALGVAAVRPIRELRIWSRSPERREALARRLGGVPVETPEEAVRGADIITTVTKASSPIVHRSDLAAGCHVTAVGSTWPDRAELDAACVRRAGRVVVELLDESRQLAGDLIQGGADWSRVVELGAIAAGLAPGRRDPAEITLCKTLGVAFGDVALARRAVENARRQGGIGREIDLGDPA